MSPVQSAITPGLRASSSSILKMIFIRSAPMSAIFVKMPPQMRNAEAPSDSPMAKPTKQAPALSLSTNSRMAIIIINSTQISSTPIDMPERSGRLITENGFAFRESNAVRELA